VTTVRSFAKHALQRSRHTEARDCLAREAAALSANPTFASKVSQGMLAGIQHPTLYHQRHAITVRPRLRLTASSLNHELEPKIALSTSKSCAAEIVSSAGEGMGGRSSSGRLDPREVDSPVFICDGPEGATGEAGPAGVPGDTGPSGAAGLNALTVIVPEEPGAACEAGGQRIDFGMDAMTLGLCWRAGMGCDIAVGRNSAPVSDIES
jgi:hypothetical protein